MNIFEKNIVFASIFNISDWVYSEILLHTQCYQLMPPIHFSEKAHGML